MKRKKDEIHLVDGHKYKCNFTELTFR